MTRTPSHDPALRARLIKTVQTGRRIAGLIEAGRLPAGTTGARFDELSQLEAGWFEGSGLAPNAEGLSSVAKKLIADYPDNLPLPQIVPKQDGNLLLEWRSEGEPSLDIDLASLHASFHAFGTNDEDVEGDFSLDPGGWKSLFAFLNDNIKVQKA